MYLTQEYLNKIQGILNYLNCSLMPPDSLLTLEAEVWDCNGDLVGYIAYNHDAKTHVFKPASPVPS